MLKTKIFAHLDIKTEAVEVPEWDCTLHVKTLTGTERAKLLAKWKDSEKTGAVSDLNAWLVVVCACEANGQRVFADADFEAVNAKNASVLDRIAQAALKINGMTPDAVEDAKKN